MFKTMLGQEWYEKVKSIEKSQTPKERYLKALQLRADLEKLQHDDIRLKASSYYEWKEYEKLLSLVDAEVLYRKAGIGMKEDKDAISPEPDKEQVKKVKYQDYIKDKNVLKEILQQLALPGNAFIDAETSKNWEQIYENHFKDMDLICSGDKLTRINWTGTWGDYCIFYDRSGRSGVFQGRNFDKDLQRSAGTFFEHHFLFRGEYKTNKQVCDGYRRSKPNIHRIDNITKILKKYSNSTALTS